MQALKVTGVDPTSSLPTHIHGQKTGAFQHRKHSNMVELGQQILDWLDNLSNRMTRNENRTIRLQNTQKQVSNPTTTTLIPLLDLQTGDTIPNCPTSVAEIYQLSGPEARRILQLLQVSVPHAVAERRTAVHEQFFN